MGFTYADVIALKFGEGEFTTLDLAIATNNPRAAKLLSDLKMRGLVERVDRGKYRLFAPSERPDLRVTEWNRVKEVVNSARWHYAWTDSTAVEIWTDGRYRISPNPFLKVFHVNIRKEDETKWMAYLKSKGVSFHRKKRVGAFVNLQPKGTLKFTLKGGEKVIPKDATIKLIRNQPGLYSGAEELIDR